MTDKILDRVKKMMALGNDAGATENERETALRMAHSLLLKHNLSMSDLPSGDENIEVREKQNFTIWADSWARDLAFNVGKLFYCKYFYCKTGQTGRENHYFVGRQSNVITSMHMAEYIIKSIKAEARKRYGDASNANGRSFCVGVTLVIQRRVNTMLANEAEGKEMSTGTALAIINLRKSELTENEKWLADEGTSLTTAKRRESSVRSSAFSDGKHFGSKVSLNRQVTGEKASLYPQLS